MATESARLDAFVADLLALARLEAEDFPIASTSVDVVAVLADVAVAWSGAAAARDVRISPPAPVSGAVVVSDAMRIRQVVDGLVENAIRVSPAGGDVSLQAVVGPDHVAIRVTDDGPGIAPDALDRVFVRGALRDRYRDERPVGTGLGLSIAARLVGRLGGRIDVESGGRGTTFVVTFRCS
jgi:two-component system, OmpR family, sensor kinase